MMNSNEAEQPDHGIAGKFFQSVQPQRDPESNWAVDLAKNLEEYLLKICSGEISGDDGPPPSVNFAEAALLLQGSIQVYSKKVEYLYSLVLHALEFISQKSPQEQTASGELDQQEESGPHASLNEEYNSFWALDDIQIEVKNLLDTSTCTEATPNRYVKPPANLVVLEGDCLDVPEDAGELESYLLATNDLYRDFILLDSSDAVTVNDFLIGNDKVTKGQNSAGRGSSLNSKGRKTFQSPLRCSGSKGHKLSVGKNQNAHLSPQINHGFEFNDCNPGSSPAANDSPENIYDSGMEGVYADMRESDDSDDDDPWKPLNPHEPGNLKIKPFKRVKTNKRQSVRLKRSIFITREFPLARLHGTICSELNEIWETRKRTSGVQNEIEPPLYEKLRQSLVEGKRDHDAFCNPDDNSEDNGYDSGDQDIGPHDMSMPEMDEDIPPPSHMNNDYGAHLSTDEAYGDPHDQTSLEDLCRSHLDALLASLAETEKQTEMAARVSTWKQRVEQNLDEQDSRPPFDIHKYGERVLDKLSLERESGSALSFADIVQGQEKHDVARTFSALLQLVNNGDVNLERDGSDHESICYTAGNPFCVRLLKDEKNRENVKPRCLKKRAKSPKVKGQGGRCSKNKVGKENRPISSLSTLRRSNSTCRVSFKLGKSGGGRSTPEGKKRRKSPVIEPVHFHYAE